MNSLTVTDYDSEFQQIERFLDENDPKRYSIDSDILIAIPSNNSLISTQSQREYSQKIEEEIAQLQASQRELRKNQVEEELVHKQFNEEIRNVIEE